MSCKNSLFKECHYHFLWKKIFDVLNHAKTKPHNNFIFSTLYSYIVSETQREYKGLRLTRQQILKSPYNLYCWLVKEKGESKPRQHTIDLSQMAVPIQVAQEKKPSPESPKPSTSEAEPSAEYIAAGNARCSLRKPTSY